MREALRVIKNEHSSIAAVLHGLRYLTEEAAHKGRTPDFRVLHAMLDYIVAFPERLHHPKEDQYLFAAMRARSAEAAPLLDKLQAEHVRGGELIRELQNTLIAYERDGTRDATAFRDAVESYVDFHWSHMRQEEDVVLPLAERILSDTDWDAIARAFKQNDDPLFGLKPKEEFAQLFQRVVMLAPPPIGVGPPTR